MRVFNDDDADARRRLISRLDEALADRHAALARAETVLHDANLADFRRALRDLFDAHPGLTSVRMDQYTQYIDDWVVLAAEHIGVNDRLIYLTSDLFYGLNEIDEDTPVDRPLATRGADDRMYQDVGGRWSEISESERRQIYNRHLRDDLGDAYDHVQAFYGLLTDLAETYGAHFFWDLFGGHASVRADRDALHVSEDVHEPEQPREPNLPRLHWIQDRLGPLTEAYLTSPEREGAAGLRAVYTDQIDRLTGSAVKARLAVEAHELRKAFPADATAPAFPPDRDFSVLVQWGRVTAVGFGAAAFDVRTGGAYGRGPARLMFERDVPAASVPPEAPGVAGPASSSVPDAVRRWLAVIDDVLTRYGADAMDPLVARSQQSAARKFTF